MTVVEEDLEVVEMVVDLDLKGLVEIEIVAQEVIAIVATEETAEIEEIEMVEKEGNVVLETLGQTKDLPVKEGPVVLMIKDVLGIRDVVAHTKNLYSA